MGNEKPLFVQCPDCEAVFNVVFNGEEVVRCPNSACCHYLYMSIEMQKKSLPEFEGAHTGVPAVSYGTSSYSELINGESIAPRGPHALGATLIHSEHCPQGCQACIDKECAEQT